MKFPGYLDEPFNIEEYVHPRIFKQWGAGAVKFIDERQLIVDIFIRDWFNVPIIINGELNGHTYVDSGYRDPASTTGGKLSQHRMGRASDKKSPKISAKEMYDEILANEQAFLMAGLTCMENIEFTPTWLHTDCRWTGLNKILIVDPV